MRTVLCVKEKSELAKRLRQLRAAWGYPGHGGQKRFAEEWLGIDGNRWSNVENDIAGLSTGLAAIICTKCPGVDFNWLYHGNTQGLSQATMQRLGLVGGPPTGSKGPLPQDL